MKHKDYMKSLQRDKNKRQKNMTMIIVATFLALSIALSVVAAAGLLSAAKWGLGELAEKNDFFAKINNTVEKIDFLNVFSEGKGKAPVVTINPAFSEEEGVASGFLGETPQFKKLILINDDRDDDFDIKILGSENVNKDEVGKYKLKYIVTDSDGNSTEFILTFKIIEDNGYTKPRLMKLIAEKAEELGITEGLSKKQKVRMIWNYVHDNNTVDFNASKDESNINKMGITKAERNKNWKKYWIQEAILTLDTNIGDCYSYYSLSRAFFEYFGINEYGIMRSKECELDGTHFWSAVEIEEGWYFYDSTRLGGSFEDGTKNACLVTKKKLDGYKTSSGVVGQFYLMDDDPNLPKMETKNLG